MSGAYRRALGKILQIGILAGLSLGLTGDAPEPQWMTVGVRYGNRVLVRSVPHSFALTKADAEYLRSEAPGINIDVFPVALDEEYFSQVQGEKEEPYSMVFAGSFLWPPKIHNLMVLLRDIFPHIKRLCPKAKLYIVGKGQTAAIQTAAEKVPGVVLTGYVPDVRPYLARAALVLQYAEIASGIPLKVLEAFAMGKAVLSNAIGCEGIEAAPGKDIAVADGRKEYAEEAALLLADEERRRNLAANAYRCARENYFWPNVEHRLEQLYRNAVEMA